MSESFILYHLDMSPTVELRYFISTATNKCEFAILFQSLHLFSRNIDSFKSDHLSEAFLRVFRKTLFCILFCSLLFEVGNSMDILFTDKSRTNI